MKLPKVVRKNLGIRSPSEEYLNVNITSGYLNEWMRTMSELLREGYIIDESFRRRWEHIQALKQQGVFDGSQGEETQKSEEITVRPTRLPQISGRHTGPCRECQSPSNTDGEERETVQVVGGEDQSESEPSLIAQEIGFAVHIPEEWIRRNPDGTVDVDFLGFDTEDEQCLGAHCDQERSCRCR